MDMIESLEIKEAFDAWRKMHERMKGLLTKIIDLEGLDYRYIKNFDVVLLRNGSHEEPTLAFRAILAMNHPDDDEDDADPITGEYPARYFDAWVPARYLWTSGWGGEFQERARMRDLALAESRLKSAVDRIDRAIKAQVDGAKEKTDLLAKIAELRAKAPPEKSS